MGKYASKDVDSGLVVTWTNVSGKPSTFAPATHSNTAHSTAYAPVNSPVFTGSPEAISMKITEGTDFTLGAIAGAQRIQGGTDSFAFLKADNSYASLLALAYKTANYSWEEDAGALVLKYGTTIILRISNAGLLKTKADQQVDSSI